MGSAQVASPLGHPLKPKSAVVFLSCHSCGLPHLCESTSRECATADHVQRPGFAALILILTQHVGSLFISASCSKLLLRHLIVLVGWPEPAPHAVPLLVLVSLELGGSLPLPADFPVVVCGSCFVCDPVK